MHPSIHLHTHFFFFNHLEITSGQNPTCISCDSIGHFARLKYVKHCNMIVCIPTINACICKWMTVRLSTCAHAFANATSLLHWPIVYACSCMVRPRNMNTIKHIINVCTRVWCIYVGIQKCISACASATSSLNHPKLRPSDFSFTKIHVTSCSDKTPKPRKGLLQMLQVLPTPLNWERNSIKDVSKIEQDSVNTNMSDRLTVALHERHKPPSPLNVGIPDSADMPAPVRTVTFCIKSPSQPLL